MDLGHCRARWAKADANGQSEDDIVKRGIVERLRDDGCREYLMLDTLLGNLCIIETVEPYNPLGIERTESKGMKA